MFILAMAMFAFGMKFIYSIFAGAEKLKDTLDDRTQQQILASMDPGTPVSLPINRYEYKRNQMDVLGIGIMNTLGYEAEFTTTVICSAAQASNGEVICDTKSGLTCSDYNWITPDDTISVNNNEKEIASLFLTIPKDVASGTYVYNIEVTVGNQPYDTIKKLYITIAE